MKERVTFLKENGQKIEGQIVRPDGSGLFPTVIFSHGFGGNFRSFDHHGDEMVKNGIAFISFDFCGGGFESLSDGTLKEMTVQSEIEDLRTVLKAVLKYDFIDPEAVFLMGESMGGFISALVAPEFARSITGLILWYPAFVVPDDSRKRYKVGQNSVLGAELSPHFNELAMNIDVYDEIKAFTGPVLIIHGDRDGLVPISYSEKAKEVYANAALTVLHGAGHGFDGEEAISARYASMRFVLANVKGKMGHDKTDYYMLAATLENLISDVPYTVTNLSNAAALIFNSMTDLNWAGFYILEGDKLILGPFQGKPACIVIPVGHGVCGTAVKIEKSIVVENVLEFPGHIACDSASRSEIVIPIFKGGKVWGVLDIDSPLFERFDDKDREGLERLCRIIEKHTELNMGGLI